MRKNKTKLVILLIFTLIIMLFTNVYADDTDKIIKDQMDALDIDEIQSFADQVNKQADGAMPVIDIKEMIMGLFKGEPIVNVQSLILGLGKLLIKEVILNFNVMGQIIVLAVFCAVLQNLHGAFEGTSVSKLAYSACYILIAIISIKSFMAAMNIGSQAIDTMVNYTQALFPTMIALLVAVGGITSSTVFQPIIFGSISMIITAIKYLVIPLVYFSAVLSLLNNLTEGIKVERLATLLRQFAVGILGVMLTVFLGVISVQGVASSSVDGMTIKTAKFAMDKFVPIVGKFLNDAFDTVVSCSMLIKNGIGIAGLIVLLMICLFPLIKIFSIIVIYKVTSALIEPILDNQIVNCLNDMGNSLLIIFSAVVSVGVLFFVFITVIMGVGNMTVMLR
ncbi:MAG: Sporulation stage protein [Clostridia bacterium]|jgi:stage III sporulation protein AE|nr:Sporulation stage protein [Clostridia bacterium]